MKKMFHRWTSLSLIFALLAGLLVPAAAYADPITIQISSLYTSADTPTDANGNLAKVQRFTISPITLSLSIGNLSDSEVPNIYYEITNMNTNTTTVDTSNKASITGTNQVTFSNVLLTEGLNKIVVKYGTVNTVTSTPGWALFTPSTSIQNLTVNNANFVNDRIYPASPTLSTSVNISGDAPNATGVQIYTQGSSTPLNTFFNSGHFSVLADDINSLTATTTFRLKPGDNPLTFVASSANRSYQVEKNLIYDNGNPFGFHAVVKEKAADGTYGADKQLITSPTLARPTVGFYGLVKVDLDTNGNLKYTKLDILSDGTPAVPQIDLSGLTKDSTWSKTGQYNVYAIGTAAIPKDVNLDTTKKDQAIKLKFTDANGNSVTTNTFNVSYVDPNSPYVDHLTIGDTTTVLGEAGSTEINELPKKLSVFTNDKTNKVNLYLGDDTSVMPYATSTTITADSGFNRFDFTLGADAPTGTMKLTAIPSTDTVTDTSLTDLTQVQNGEFDLGKKQYDINISSVPYFVVDNIYNGMNIQGPGNLTCGAFDTPCVHFRLVNSPTTPDIRLHINNSTFNIGSGTYQITADDTTDLSKGYHLSFDGSIINEGKNTIQLELYEGGNLVTQSTYEIFKFGVGSPEFEQVVPIENGNTPKYPASQIPDTYTTSEMTVALKGQFKNASEIKLTVRSKDANGFPVVTYDRRYNDFAATDQFPVGANYFSSITAPNGSTPGQFATNPINLAATGNTTFEFVLTNSSNSTVTKTITITRQPEPYTIIYPSVTKNENGEDQANINTNNIEIEMAAEGADSVLFGKEQADVRQVTVNSQQVNHFFYKANNLRPGKNTLKFTINRGSNKTSGSLILYNTDTSVAGAQYTTALTSNIKAFGGIVQLTFPKGTSLMRNDPEAVNPIVTPDRKLLFGLADSTDGRIDKYKHPAASDGQVGNPNTQITQTGPNLLKEPTGHFRAVSPLIWIDAGTIADGETDLKSVYNGGGNLPYDDNGNAVPFYSRSAADLVVPTQRGQLTLKYDENIRDDAWRYLTVYHFDIYEDYTGAVQPRWRNVGGVVDSKNHSITVPIDNFGYYQVMYMNQSFDDVNSHPWARNDLDTLYAKGIMLNKRDDAFVPNDPISRGEFATMLVRIFDIPLQYDNNATFRDVPRVNPLGSKLYDYKYIETAARTGIVRGATLDMFFPDSALTRQDAAVMIARAANLKLSNDDNRTLQSLQKLFTDAQSIDIYARTSVEAITKAGLIEGIENALQPGQKKATLRFDPTETFTRAEAATVAIRVLKQQKKIPK